MKKLKKVASMEEKIYAFLIKLYNFSINNKNFNIYEITRANCITYAFISIIRNNGCIENVRVKSGKKCRIDNWVGKKPTMKLAKKIVSELRDYNSNQYKNKTIVKRRIASFVSLPKSDSQIEKMAFGMLGVISSRSYEIKVKSMDSGKKISSVIINSENK